MVITEEQSWEWSKNELKALKDTDFYKNDVELQKLVLQQEELLEQIVPYLRGRNEEQWSKIRSLNCRIDFRIRMNETGKKEEYEESDEYKRSDEYSQVGLAFGGQSPLKRKFTFSTRP